MLDHSSKYAAQTSGDPLTDVLRGLRLDGVEYGRCRMAHPWAISFPEQHSAWFHFVCKQGCWLQMPDSTWIALGSGDAVLLPRGAPHVLASAPGVAEQPIEQFARRPVCENICDVDGCGNGDPSTMLLYGNLHFNIDGLHPLLQMMPDVMRAKDLSANEPSIPHLIDAMAREVVADRVGSAGITARLADVLAATIIRAWVETGPSDAAGWVAALRNPDIGRVLAAIHLNPIRDWTVAMLAKEMGASRSSFAAQFAGVVGQTPARYVTQVRMHQARQWLIRDRLRITVVASRLGYDSEASFSRAFKRVIGVAPSLARQAAVGAR
jgi:AraC-like DNA-binding protein